MILARYTRVELRSLLGEVDEKNHAKIVAGSWFQAEPKFTLQITAHFFAS